jgi:hypothetical protein
MATALSIVQTACGRMSLDVPQVLFSSTNDLDIQMRDILNEELIDLARLGAWQNLIAEQTFTTVATEAQTSSVPTDFDWFLNDTMFNRSVNRQIIGPITPQEWQREKAGPNFIYSANSAAFRFRGGTILITPTPIAGDTVGYEYVKNTRALAADTTTYKSIFSADTDTPLLDAELLTQGIIWRFKQRKGFDYAEDFTTYDGNVDKALARDGGKKIINLTGGAYQTAYNMNIKEGNWP